MIDETSVDARSEPEMRDEIARSVVEREISDECMGPWGINVELLVAHGRLDVRVHEVVLGVSDYQYSLSDDSERESEDAREAQRAPSKVRV